MHISKKHKFVFIDIPKTASLTLDTIFENTYGAKLHRPPKGSYLGEKHSRQIPDWAKSYTRVTCVRNPFERICSFYHFMKKQSKLFDWYGIHNIDDFIDVCLDYSLTCPDDEPHGWKYRMFPAWKYLRPTGYDIVLRQEHLAEDFAKLPFVTGEVTLPEKNRNNSNTGWAEEYTSDRRNKIQTWAEHDFDMFGYDPDYKGKQS